MELGEGIKKLLLAGIGTAAVTAEKSKEVLDELVKKGELTVEQGKVLNQELKHNIKESVKKNVNVTLNCRNYQHHVAMLIDISIKISEIRLFFYTILSA